MPKIVARPERREFLVGATWELIVAEGLGAVTLRKVAATAGFANGALKPYFSTKSELMEASYQLAFDRTNARAKISVGELGGIEAVRRLCREIMPLDEVRRVEARVVIAFWEAAVTDPTISVLARTTMQEFVEGIVSHLLEAWTMGEVASPDVVALHAIADELLWMMMGLQSLCWLTPEATTPARQNAVLDRILGSLAPTSVQKVQRAVGDNVR
ncbi:MAG: TetR/AcrR family transcriptional regulator [Arachnia sp.]